MTCGGDAKDGHELTGTTKDACHKACTEYSSHAFPAHGFPGCCTFVPHEGDYPGKCYFFSGKASEKSLTAGDLEPSAADCTFPAEAESPAARLTRLEAEGE